MFPKGFFTTRVKVGLALIWFSGIGWILEFSIPFTKLSNPQKAASFAAVVVIAEIVFLAGVAVVGKPTYKLIKGLVIARLKRQTPPTAQN